MKTGTAYLPLHYGSAPRWLFDRMKKLAREISIIIISEFGSEDMLIKLSDPAWFQAFGCVLGFDWHSSGLTTTTCGALKEGIKGLERDLGLFIAGGKGATSRKTPEQIKAIGDKISLNPEPLVYASRLSAKVDNTALQDGYQLYHHTFFFVPSGKWAVVQQGMNTAERWARRYHWLSEKVSDFVCEPHSGVICDHKGKPLNLVAKESEETRDASAELAKENPEKLTKELKRIQALELPSRHHILASDIRPENFRKIMLNVYEKEPENFEALLGTAGVGPKTLRALALISELIYGTEPSFKDPVRFSFAHGGKDGHPYPVDREQYDKSIEILKEATSRAKVERSEKLKALERLANV